MNEVEKDEEVCTMSLINNALLDPFRWGWTVGGGIMDVLGPHERARRRATKEAWLEAKNDNVGDEKQIKESAGLNAYSYHRGVAGQEARDPGSGELLYDITKTDTAHDFDPCFKVKVKVSFPLLEPENAEEPSLAFKETVEWDLMDPSTPTPMQYASTIAENYGLSFTQVCDLANSIEHQIHHYAKKHLSHIPPITVNDPQGTPRALHTLDTVLHTSITNQPPTIDLSQKIPKAKKNTTSSKPCRRMHLPYRPNITFKTPEIYRNEVIRRAKEEKSHEIHALAKNKKGPPGQLKIETNHVCHICHARKPHACIFPCDNSSHAYCDSHMTTRLGLPCKQIKEQGFTLDYCPVCCLVCQCAKCSRRLDSVASDFKKECEKQNIEIEDLQSCQMEILGMTSGKPSQAPKKATPVSSKKRALVEEQYERREKRTRLSTPAPAPTPPPIPSPSPPPPPLPKPPSIPVIPDKIPISEFPKEICNSKDIEPSSQFDRDIVYAPPSQTHTPPTVTPQPYSSEEDGSISHCFLCNRGGSLICCDHCPRAFHPACVHLFHPESLTEEHWKCPRCVRDETIQEEDYVSGDRSLDLIAAAFVQAPYCKTFCKKLRILAKIHEMLLKLIHFDFAFVFREPVNKREVPDYYKIISRPMSLATVCCNLINGKYLQLAKDPEEMGDEEATKAFDDCILSALKDIELIWHNCMLFNEVGSTFYRAAGVQMRKCRNIRKASIDRYLDPPLLHNLQKFVYECDEKRHLANADADPEIYIPPKTIEDFCIPIKRPDIPRPLAIQVPVSLGGTNRIVAVLDPRTNKIVKKYSTIKAAATAATFLAGLGYAAEIDVQDHSVKQLIRRSNMDPDLTLFTYRWLFYDELRRGFVAFHEDHPQEDALDDDFFDDYYIEKVVKQLNYKDTYKSIDKAYKNNCENVKQDHVSFHFFKHILANSKNKEVSVMGNTWRLIPKQKRSGGENRESENLTETRESSTQTETPAVEEIQNNEIQKEEIQNKETSEEIQNKEIQNKEIQNKEIQNKEIQKPETQNKEIQNKETQKPETQKPETDRALPPEENELGKDTFFTSQSLQPNFPPSVIIEKQDMVSCAVLTGYETVDAAYYDWIATRQKLPQMEDPDTIQVFLQYYLQGDRNVDGVRWNFCNATDLNKEGGKKEVVEEKTNEREEEEVEKDIREIEPLQPESTVVHIDEEPQVQEPMIEIVELPQEKPLQETPSKGELAKEKPAKEKPPKEKPSKEKPPKEKPTQQPIRQITKFKCFINGHQVSPYNSEVDHDELSYDSDFHPKRPAFTDYPPPMRVRMSHKEHKVKIVMTHKRKSHEHPDKPRRSDSDDLPISMRYKIPKRKDSGVSSKSTSSDKPHSKDPLDIRIHFRNDREAEEGIHAAMVAASSITPLNRDHYHNQRRGVVVIDTHTMKIADHFTSMLQAKNSLRLSEKRIAQYMEERRHVDNRFLYVDALEADKVFREMKEAVLGVLRRDGDS